MALLAQFLLRLSFGLAVGMAITSPRQVSSGYYRNHLYVTLGLATLACLVAIQFSALAAWLAGSVAILSYISAVCWLYEARRPGVALLWAVAGCSLAAAFAGHAPGIPAIAVPDTLTATATAAPVAEIDSVLSKLPIVLSWVSVVTSGLVLGITFAAMLLGHWYLNSPGMELEPLRRLLKAIAITVSVQILVSGIGLAAELSIAGPVSPSWLLFVLLRWSFGLIGVLGLIWMTWQTLRVPNTQSATGILYVAVIGVFVGELTAQLLSAESTFPL